MKHINERELFETSDISLANTICCFGGKIEAINKTNPSRAIFIFKRSKKLDALIQGFWTHTLQVDPLNYFNNLKEIKTRLYQTIE
jgi:hypothetical protein